MVKKIGLVLSGGGAKGAYQIGCWQALIDLGIAPLIHGVSGTSVGAINGILFVQNDISIAYEIWNNVKTPPLQVNSLSKNAQLLTKIIGLDNMRALHNITNSEILRSENLQQNIAKYIKSDLIAKFGGDCFVAAHDIAKKQPVYFNMKEYSPAEQKRIILSSASIPYIYSSVAIDGKKYSDGGLSDNTPIKPLYDASYDVIIVIYLSKKGFRHSSLFPGAQIINLVPSRSLGDFRSGTLNFDQAKIDQMIKQGYEDTFSFCLNSSELQELIPKQIK